MIYHLTAVIDGVESVPVKIGKWSGSLDPDGRLVLSADFNPLDGVWSYNVDDGAWQGAGHASTCLREIAYAWMLAARSYLRDKARQRVIQAIQTMPAVIVTLDDGVEVDGRGWMISELRGELIDRTVASDGRSAVTPADAHAAILRLRASGYPATSWCPLLVLDALRLVEQGVDGAVEVAAIVRAEAQAIWLEAGPLKTDEHGNLWR